MTNKQIAQDKIKSLVSRFEDQYESYKHIDYNETLTRRDFIDPFFKALGWDMDNESGYAEAYREVIHEDKVKVSGATKAPDYSFRLGGGKRLFFVEAKKPSVSVKDDIHPAYQIRRYGWSAKMPISIITDFEEFSIYDCTKKPKPEDKAAVARIKFLSFRDYIKEFDFIWDTFSKEQVLKGSFDKFLLSDTHKKGTATVDKDFLESLDRWRTYLAVNISWNNRTLNEDEINFVVQQTIDRIIFLRIAEDRNVEPYGTLKHAIRQGKLYQNLFELFQKADEKYNSGLFDFKKDKISQDIFIENKIIRTIINELYYPECPYEFSVLSVEILGSAYEQFLGKVIRITPAHHAKIEEKPEVRKAGGVYYTPQYIVDYIVKNTVGKLIEGKTPKEISKIRILDPACGSGSFLIGAFQYLLDYHKDYYSENGKPSKGRKDNPLTPDGHLTTSEKKRILLNNIYGVDLDTNAVEVTKLSLLIKCLEGETDASIKQQLAIWNERVLPTLENNIKSGNSLIGSDFYDNKLDFNIERTIKPFNWHETFPDIFTVGGFDIVIGNPPYVDSRTNDPIAKEYWKTHYSSCNYGKTNAYEIFLEKGLILLKPNGILSYIIPIVLLNVESCTSLRSLLVNNYSIEEIAYGEFAVFSEANVDTMVIRIRNLKRNKTINTEIKKFSKGFNEIIETHIIDYNSITKDKNLKISVKDNPLLEQIKTKVPIIKLSQIVDFYNGIATGPSKESYFSQRKENKNYKPLLTGSDIGYYKINYAGLYINYDRDKLHRPREEKIFKAGEKIVMQRIRNLKLERRLVCALDTCSFYTFNSVNNLLIKEGSKYNLRYILALLNSSLLNYLIKQISLNTNLTLSDLDLLPIRAIDFNLKSDVILYNELIKLVDELIEIIEYEDKIKLSTELDQLRSKKNYIGSRMDNIILELYGIKPDELKNQFN